MHGEGLFRAARGRTMAADLDDNLLLQVPRLRGDMESA